MSYRIEPSRLAKWNILLRLAIFCVLAVPLASAQTPSVVTQSLPRAPLFLLYRHFLAYQNHLDRVAAQLDQQGQDGSGFRNHFEQKLGFSEAEFAPVRATALRLETELKEEDAKIKAVIDAARAKYPRELLSRSALPPPPPELKQMQKDREALIQHEIDQMNAALGPRHAAKLQEVIENDFAPSVRVQSIHPPMLPNDPAKRPLPPFPQGVN